MKWGLFSTKIRVSHRHWLWCLLLFGLLFIYYFDLTFFTNAFFMAVLMTSIVTGMVVSGYKILGLQKRFPRKKYCLLVLIFSSIRIGFIYFVLQYYADSFTVFKYPGRSVIYVICTSAAIIYTGYAFAIYEWGLAAREKYKMQTYTSPISIKVNGSYVYLLPSDITHIQANGEYVNYYTENRTYTSYRRLKEVEADLREYGFLRCHRSFIVNIADILEIKIKSIVLKNNKNIPLSKMYYDRIKNAKTDDTKMEVAREKQIPIR